MGIGDLDTQAPKLSSYSIIPTQSPILIFPVFKKIFSPNFFKKRNLFFHSFLEKFLYNIKVLGENRFWDSDHIFGAPVRHSGFLHPNLPSILPAFFCAKGTKMAKNSIHFRKVISSSRGSSHNPSDTWCGFGRCSSVRKNLSLHPRVDN